MPAHSVRRTPDWGVFEIFPVLTTRYNEHNANFPAPLQNQEDLDNNIRAILDNPDRPKDIDELLIFLARSGQHKLWLIQQQINEDETQAIVSLNCYKIAHIPDIFATPGARILYEQFCAPAMPITKTRKKAFWLMKNILEEGAWKISKAASPQELIENKWHSPDDVELHLWIHYMLDHSPPAWKRTEHAKALKSQFKDMVNIRHFAVHAQLREGQKVTTTVLVAMLTSGVTFLKQQQSCLPEVPLGLAEAKNILDTVKSGYHELEKARAGVCRDFISALIRNFALEHFNERAAGSSVLELEYRQRMEEVVEAQSSLICHQLDAL